MRTLRNIGEISSFDIIVCLQKDRPQTRLSNRIVFQVKFIKPMERVGVRLKLSSDTEAGV